MKISNSECFVDLAQHMADVSGEILRRSFQKSNIFTDKSDASPVTEIDLTVERAIRGMIQDAYPEHGMANLKIKMDSIKKAGVDVICVNCPACFQQFDTQQRDLSKKYEADYNIPVLYLTELLALAMGISADDIGLKFHRTRLKDVLEKLGL